MTSQPSAEPIIEPTLPIVDAHHHMWLQSEAALAALDAQDTIISRSIGPTYRKYARYLLEPKFREGFKQLKKFDLSFDVLLLEPQRPDLIDLARAFPETQIILNHVGVPMGIGRHAGKREERFPIWRENIRTLAQCANVAVKLSGLGIAAPGFKSFNASPPFTSEQLANEWRPYVETCIGAFGAHRCMFASNFPVDKATCSYPVQWNAYKRLAGGASKEKKAALFSGTAKRIYRLEAQLS
jgi:predicted TIM-barrel fold metal-dependent hydrolase